MDRYRNLNRVDLVRLVAEAEASLAASAGDEAQRLVHDLHLHQIELEIQNQDLRAAQSALEAARDDYAELYDFAPVGYLSLDPNGLIQKLNLTAAKLLGRERAKLLHKPFVEQLVKGSSNQLFKHLRTAFASSESTSAELLLKAREEMPPREVRLDSRPHLSPDGQPWCLTTVTDISDTKHLERQLRASHAELATLLAGAPVGISIVEQDAFRSLNARFAEMLGYLEQELLGQHARMVFADADEYERVLRSTQARIATNGIGEVETRMRHKDGRLLDVLLCAATLDITAPHADTILTALDISEQKQTARSLAETQRTLDLALEGGDIGTYQLEFPSGAITADGRYLEMLGHAPGGLDLDWKACLAMIHAEDRPAVETQVQVLIRGEQDHFEAEYRMQHRRGHWVWVLDRGQVFERDGTRDSLRLAGTHMDITRRREAERQVMRLVEHDELTGLLNRRGMLRSIHRIHASAMRSGQPYCLAILDLDHFKQVNDAYGHNVGDEVLRRVAEQLTKDLRREDWVGRWGGEEFVVALPGSTEAQAMHTIERLRNGVGKQRIQTQGFDFGITLSAGVALCRAPADDPNDVLRLADAALYRAKAAGRDRTIFNGHALGRQAISIAILVQDALRTAGIQPAYQAIVELRGRRVVGTEAFARIVGEDCTIVNAASFLQVAEQLGLMHKIDRLLVLAMLRQMTERALAGAAQQLFFVNLSGDLLQHRDMVTDLADALRADPAAAERARSLVLKITERQISGGAEQIAATLAPLLELGCRLAIGDCGGSASSYRFLTDLPVDFVELDAQLIRLAAESPRARAVLAGIVNAAREIGQTTIAKQVEDQATVDLLLELGVDWGQGFLFGRPSEPTAKDQSA